MENVTLATLRISFNILVNDLFDYSEDQSYFPDRVSLGQVDNQKGRRQHCPIHVQLRAAVREFPNETATRRTVVDAVDR